MMQQLRAIVLAAVVGDVAITLYLIVVAAVAGHASIGMSLLRLMQWDASNGYGDAAFAGGWAMAGVGQLMDLVVSLVWASIFTALYLRFPVVRRNTWAWGLAFGVVVMVVMLYVLVPIGHARPMHNNSVNVVRVLIAHTVFFGLPIALVVARLVTAPLRLQRS
jgi:hypothetical protein